MDLGAWLRTPIHASHERRETPRVTAYFLVEDLTPSGIVNVEGDHKIHVSNVHGNRLELDRAFDVDFDRDISTGPARPHGVALFQAQDD